MSMYCAHKRQLGTVTIQVMFKLVNILNYESAEYLEIIGAYTMNLSRLKATTSGLHENTPLVTKTYTMDFTLDLNEMFYRK